MKSEELMGEYSEYMANVSKGDLHYYANKDTDRNKFLDWFDLSIH